MCSHELPEFIKELEWDISPNICPEDEWCGEQVFDRVPAGYFPQYEAIDSPPCPAYVPTRYELMVLAVHWFTEARYMELLQFCEARLVPEDYAILDPARERLDLLGEVLGEESRSPVLAAVEKECRDRLGDLWLAYRAHEAALKSQREGDCKGPAAESETAMPTAAAEAAPYDFFETLKRMRDAKAKRQA